MHRRAAGGYLPYAFSKGIHVFFSEILKPDTLHAVWLTVLTAIVVVPINMAFGVCVAWLVTKFRFPGRRLLITFVEIPFSVSPIVAGVTYLFLCGSQGLLGPFLEAHDIKIMFTVPAIFLVKSFVTSPFVARELIPLMEVQGSDEEEAALTLGASAWQTFFYVHLAQYQMGLALWRGALQCACHGRVWRNVRRVGRDPRQDQYIAASRLSCCSTITMWQALLRQLPRLALIALCNTGSKGLSLNASSILRA